MWLLCESSALGGPDCATTNGAFTSSSHFSGAGGTSAATPAFAGMLALVEQATGSRLGNANNVIYKLAANKYSTVFHDVTAGNNAVVCTAGSTACGSNGFTTGYNAGVGYDLASGLGSVDAAAMLSNWASAVGTGSATTLTINGSASPVSVVHGTSLNFAVGVNPVTATGSAGLVTTAAAAAGAPTLNGQAFTIPVANGTGAGTYNGLPGGQYTVYATYGGDTNTAASKSTPISVTIGQEASSTQLTVAAYSPAEATISNLNAIPYGSYIFAETSVYGTAEGFNASLGLATGSTTIYDNGTNIGTSPITSGNFASFPAIVAGVYPYAPGPHSVTAKYAGDASHSANTSNAVSFTVTKGTTATALYPTTTTLLSTATDSVQVDITTSSLANAPTGTVTLTSGGKTLATSTSLTPEISFSGTATGVATFNLAGSMLAAGVNTVTASYSGDANYGASTGTVKLTVSQASFALSAASVSLTAGSTTGNTTAITATSAGGFAGLVNLACAVTTAPASVSSPITCSVPAQIDLSGTTATTATLTVHSTTSTTAGTYVVTITGTDAATGKLSATTTSTVNVAAGPNPGITLTNSAGISVSAGATTGNTSTITAAPGNGFMGAVGLSCLVTSTPANANANQPVTCSIAPSTLTITGTTPAMATLTIKSEAPQTTPTARSVTRNVSGTVLAFGLFLLPFGRRRRVRGLLAFVVLISLGGLVGCSGGGSSSGGTTTIPGTTAGAYVVTVTANPANAAAQTTTVNVTVN